MTLLNHISKTVIILINDSQIVDLFKNIWYLVPKRSEGRIHYNCIIVCYCYCAMESMCITDFGKLSRPKYGAKRARTQVSLGLWVHI